MDMIIMQLCVMGWMIMLVRVGVAGVSTCVLLSMQAIVSMRVDVGHFAVSVFMSVFV
jgi:hypothetical protein